MLLTLNPHHILLTLDALTKWKLALGLGMAAYGVAVLVIEWQRRRK